MNHMNFDLIRNLYSARVDLGSRIGCAISRKHLILPKDTFPIGVSYREIGTPIYLNNKLTEYRLAQYHEQSEYIVFQSNKDLGQVLGLDDKTFPKISDEAPLLGQCYGTILESTFRNPMPDPELGGSGLVYEGLHVVYGGCSLVAVPKDRTVRFLLNFPEMYIPSGSPVFDSKGCLCGLIKYGFRNDRYSQSDRFASNLFEVIPIYRQILDTGKLLNS
jgi:hypothetical protein